MVNDNVHYTVVEKLDGSHAPVNPILVLGNVSAIEDGQIAVVEESGIVHGATGLAPEKTYRIAIGKGNGEVEFSPEFLGKNLLKQTYTDYKPAANKIEKLSFYNVEDNTVYTVNILIRDTHTTFGNKEMYKFGTYKSGVGATGLEVAIGLVNNLIKNFSREPEQIIEFSVLSDDTGTAITTDLAVTNGSPIITIGAGEVVLGDFVRLGVTVDDNVYRVVELIDATHVKLDRLVIEATNGALTSQTVVNNDSVHILFTGVDKSRFDPGLWKFEPADFNVQNLEGAASVSLVQGATAGIGTWQTVAEEEWFAKGNRGYGIRVDPMLPVPTSKVRTIEGEQYESAAFVFKDQRFTNIVGQSPASIGTVTIYCSDATQTSLKTILG